MGLLAGWVIGVLAVTAAVATWDQYRRRRRRHVLAVADPASSDPSLAKPPPDDKPETPAISLVLLLREPRELDPRAMAQCIRNAWGIELDVDDPQAKEFVVCVAPGAMIQISGVNFLVHNWPRPYVDEPAVAGEQLGEQRLRAAMAQHRAWLSVDLLRQSGSLSERRIYQLIGKLAAELADPGTLAIYCPQTHRMLPFDEVTRRKLRSDDVLAALAEVNNGPAAPVPASDDRMAAAEAEARRRWPEFVEAFEQRNGDEHFAVKMPFGEGDRSEYLWIEVSAIENEIVYGRLGNKPLHVRRLNEGDSVRAKIADLHDWAYVKQGKSHGLFTMQIAHEVHRRPPEQEET